MLRKMFESSGLRLGGTSWVVPGTFADNMRYLSTDVSDMEIVLFDTPEYSNMPDRDEVLSLKELSLELGMTCTVHLPADILGTAPEPLLCDAEEKCFRTFDLFAPLEPFAWILHLVGEKRGDPPSGDIDNWLEKSLASAKKIAGALSDKTKICVETLDYDPKHAEFLAEEAGVSLCLDVGHLIKCGYPVREAAKRSADIARVIHIHGVRPDGTDHCDLSYFDPALFKDLCGIMSDGRERVMTIEVFEDDYARSIETLKKERVWFRHNII